MKARASLDEFDAALRDSGNQLTDAAVRVAGGEIPDQELVNNLAALRSDFLALHATTWELAAATEVDLGSAELPATITGLRSAFDLVERAAATRAEEVQAREAAISILARVMAIVHPEVPIFEPLAQARATALELHQAVDALPWEEMRAEANALAGGTHPLACLLALVERADLLADADWDRCQAAIEDAFGKPLAIAAVRGRLAVASRPHVPRPPTGDGESGEMSPDRLAAADFSTEERIEAVADEATTPGSGSAGEPIAPPPDEGPRDEGATDAGVLTAADDLSADAIGIAAPKEPAESQAPEFDDGVARLPESAADRLTAECGDQEPETPVEALSPEEAVAVPAAQTDHATEEPEIGPADLHASVDAGFSAEATAKDIAVAILAGTASPTALHDLIGRLVFDGRLGFAYHLAQGIEGTRAEVMPRLPSWVIRTLGLGAHIRYDSGELAALLRNDFAGYDDAVFAAGNPTWNRTMRFFLIAAALRPALLAPSTGAAAVLQDLHLRDGLGELTDYVRAIAEFGHAGQALDAQALKKVKDADVWRAERDELCREVEAWLAQAPTMRNRYAAASAVWRSWTEPGGMLVDLLRPICENDTAAFARVRDEVERLSDDGEFRRLVDETDRMVNRRQIREKIYADAYEQLRRNQRKALGFAQRWLALLEVRPDRERGYHQVQAEAVRERIQRRQDGACRELEDERAEADAACVAPGLLHLAAIEACRRAVDDVAALFDPEAPLAAEEPSVRYLLHAELLRVSSLVLATDWRPEAEPAAVVEALVALAAVDNEGWSRAFEARRDARDHEATERIIEYLAAIPTAAPGIPLDALRQERLRHLRDCRQALVADADAASQAIERTVMLGLLEETERLQLSGQVEDVRARASEVLRFGPEHEALGAIRHTLAEKQEAAVAAVETRLEGEDARSRLATVPGAEARIRAVLTAGDAPTATEYIDMVLAGHGLPDVSGDPDLFREFFAERFDAIYRYLNPEGQSALLVQRRILDEANAGGGPVALHDELGRPGMPTALMTAWYTAKNAGAFNATGVAAVLTQIGFPNPRATPQRAASPWFEVTTDPLADPARCPVHAYGSSAGGRYRVLVVKNVLHEDDLLGAVGETSRGAPVIVFHLGALSARRRRDLAHLCRRLGRTFLVLDDVLLYFLCGVRGSRLRAFFACSLPFTALNPYTTTASLVPPEVFYGRQRERQEIGDRLGSCFIYGGRQLGKTALLRDVERSFHDPANGRVAVWLDLKVEGIGYDRPIDDIWRQIGLQLKRTGVLRTASAESDRLLASILSWLDEDTQRRILLLLDEADRFLESDANEEFVRVARIKGLMDRSDRRFKAVFAGLHNVQRTARRENQPLAHYGEPLQIGPLLDDSEWKEARDLIERPLASLGYRFESPDLVTRILSRTNYYPSLIQLYCSHLVRHVTDADVARFDRQKSPPYVLTLAHVDGAYQSPELRNAIRDRFLWTLDLDPRYRVIAFAIAYESTGPSARSAREGLSTDWIREQALTWWPQGFAESTAAHVFRELLDEMVGLGILRRMETKPDWYALRSQNIVTLLGTREEIARELLQSEQREPPIAYAPATFRASYRNTGEVDRSRRSPLTALQESELRSRHHGVSIVFGCQAAGLSDVSPFLRSAVGPAFFAALDGATDRAQFARAFDRLRLGDRDQVGTTIVFVAAGSPWSESWVEEALARVGRFRSRLAFVRVVFLADPAGTWRLLAPGSGQAVTELDRLVEAGVQTTALRPWDPAALRHWLEDAEFAPGSPDGWKEIARVTGNWPILLDRLHRTASGGGRHWQTCLNEIEARVEDQGMAEELASAFGLDEPTPRRVLHDLATVGEATTDDLIAIVEGEIPADRVLRCLRWADLLGLASPTGGQVWRVDPVVDRIVTRLPE